MLCVVGLLFLEGERVKKNFNFETEYKICSILSVSNKDFTSVIWLSFAINSSNADKVHNSSGKVTTRLCATFKT